MKRITLLALLFLSTGAFAQSEYNWNWDWDFDKTMYQPIQYTPPKGMNTVVFTSTNKKGKIKKYQKTYTSEGNLIAYSELDKTEKFVPIVEYTYDDQNLIKSSKSYKKGKLKSTVEKTRLEKGKPLEVKKTNAKNEVVSKNTWEYNANKCVVVSKRYKKDNLYRSWEYEYRGDCDKSKSVLKKKSGKVVRVWSYDCKEEGEILTKKKNETQVCKYEEVNKDYLIRVKEYFNEKGEVVKSISKFTLTDTLIVETITYNNDGEMTRKSTYDKDYKKPLVSVRYKNGKEQYKNEYTYVNNNVATHTYSSKGKYRSKFEYTYENDRLVERKSFDNKNDLRSTISLAYS